MCFAASDPTTLIGHQIEVILSGEPNIQCTVVGYDPASGDHLVVTGYGTPAQSTPAELVPLWGNPHAYTVLREQPGFPFLTAAAAAAPEEPELLELLPPELEAPAAAAAAGTSDRIARRRSASAAPLSGTPASGALQEVAVAPLPESKQLRTEPLPAEKEEGEVGVDGEGQEGEVLGVSAPAGKAREFAKAANTAGVVGKGGAGARAAGGMAVVPGTSGGGGGSGRGQGRGGEKERARSSSRVSGSVDQQDKAPAEQQQQQQQGRDQHESNQQQQQQQVEAKSKQRQDSLPLQIELPDGVSVVESRPASSPDAYVAVEGKSVKLAKDSYWDDLREAALLNMFLFCCWTKADDPPQRQTALLLNAVPLKFLQLPAALHPKGSNKEAEEVVKTLLYKRKGRVFVRCDQSGVQDSHGECVRLVPGYLQGVLEHGFFRKWAQEVGEELRKDLGKQVQQMKEGKGESGLDQTVFTRAVQYIPGLVFYQKVRVGIRTGSWDSSVGSCFNDKTTVLEL